MTAPSSPIASIRADVFISYAREDIRIAQRLVHALEAGGHTVALDTMAIAAGEDWQARLDALLRASAKVVFIATPVSLASAACAREIAAALRQGKPILPVIPGDLPGHLLPADLRHLNYARLNSADDWSAGLASLSQAIGMDLVWERAKALYLDRAGSQHPVLADRAELLAAQDWAINRPEKAPPIPQAVATMIDHSARRLARRDRLLKLGLGLVALVFAALCTLAFSQWARQIEATRQADIETALRAAGPVGDLLEQGRQVEALLALRAAVANLVDTGPVTADMHGVLRSALRRTQGQSRYTIPDTLTVHDFGGQVLLHDPTSGAFLRLGKDGLVPTGAPLPGKIIVWDQAPGMGQGILVRDVAETLYLQAFDPKTAEAGPILATLLRDTRGDGVDQAVIGPDGLVLVNRYKTRTDSFFEGAVFGEPLGSWVIDLRTATRIDMEPGTHDLWNDRSGRSYLRRSGDGATFRFDPVTRSLVTAERGEREDHLRNVFYTCFRHHLNDPDLEGMIDRMQEQGFPDDLSNSSFTLQRPECRMAGTWLVTLTGRTSGSGFWRDVAIFDREQLLDRDGSRRDEGLFDPEEGAARVRYSMLRGSSLPGLSADDGYDPRYVGFDGRTMIGSFLSGESRSSSFGRYAETELPNDAPFEAAVLLDDTFAAWVEAPQPNARREVIVVSSAATGDEFVEQNGAAETAPDVTTAPADPLPIRFPDGRSFSVEDQAALGLDGLTLSVAKDAPVIVASNWSEGIWRVSPNSDGAWTRTLLVMTDSPASVLAVSNDGSLAAVLHAGATSGQDTIYVMSTSDGKIVDRLGSLSYGPPIAVGATDFAIPPTRYHFPTYAGYAERLDRAIHQLCPNGC